MRSVRLSYLARNNVSQHLKRELCGLAIDSDRMRRRLSKFVFADLLNFQDMRILATELEKAVSVPIFLELYQDELTAGIAFARPPGDPGKIHDRRKNMELVECRFFVLKSDSKTKPMHRPLIKPPDSRTQRGSAEESERWGRR
jgi:hypothetical protein